MATCCSYCGADLSNRPGGAVFGYWDSRCPDCGLNAEDEVAMLAPGGEEIEYGLGEWAPQDRVLLRNALVERDVPWRWEPGPLLVVDERDQSLVEEVLDDLEAEEPAVGADEASEAGPADEVEEDGGDDALASQAMGDLFVVADRLQHTPANGPLVEQLDQLASVVEGSAPPFGVERETWRQMGALARSVVQSAEAADEEAVAEGARSLREFLRDYV